MAADAWPSIRCTALTFAPAEIASDAAVCRRSCRVTAGGKLGSDSEARFLAARCRRPCAIIQAVAATTDPLRPGHLVSHAERSGTSRSRDPSSRCVGILNRRTAEWSDGTPPCRKPTPQCSTRPSPRSSEHRSKTRNSSEGDKSSTPSSWNGNEPNGPNNTDLRQLRLDLGARGNRIRQGLLNVPRNPVRTVGTSSVTTFRCPNPGAGVRRDEFPHFVFCRFYP
jgi:hypothetical protein